MSYGQRMDIRLTMVRNGFKCWIACLLALLTFASSVAAEAPTIRDKTGRLRATIVPANDWCSSVVSVNIRANKDVFDNSPEDVQRLIGAARLGILEDCPVVEIIRIHGLVDETGVFQAYTAKAIGWRIQVYASVGGVLSMLDAKQSPAEFSHNLAYFETRTEFARAKLPNVVLNPDDPIAESARVSWRIEGIDGATYVLSNRSKTFPTLGDLADAIAHQLAEQCGDEGKGAIENPDERNVASNIQTRSFVCVQLVKRNVVAILVKEIDDVATIFIMTSESSRSVDTLMSFMSDKSIIY